MTGKVAAQSSVADVAARVELVRQKPDSREELVAMLAEQSPIFAGRGTNEAERLRGYILASFEAVGLPDEAVPYVLEELETGRNPYTVAAAARALRGSSSPPPEAARLLVFAIARLRGKDEAVSFDRFDLVERSEGEATCLVELARALGRFGPQTCSARDDLRALLDVEGETFSPAVRAVLADVTETVEGFKNAPTCCAGHGAAGPVSPPPSSGVSGGLTKLADLPLEDQDAGRRTLGERFAGRPTALAFFYTRCMNPAKCSLTVTRLARLANDVRRDGPEANVAGITYDPSFDLPPRLRRYGLDRGMAFSSHCSLLRTIGPFEPLKEALDLGVGFGPVTVNRHRLDLVVLDAYLGTTEVFERRLWQEDTVREALRRSTPLQLRGA